MKFLSVLVVLCIGYVSYDTWFGRNGVEQFRIVSAQVAEAKQKSEKLTMRNQAVLDEIADLNQDNLTIEELARDDLGMIKNGETFYRVIESASYSAGKRSR